MTCTRGSRARTAACLEAAWSTSSLWKTALSQTIVTIVRAQTMVTSMGQSSPPIIASNESTCQIRNTSQIITLSQQMKGTRWCLQPISGFSIVKPPARSTSVTCLCYSPNRPHISGAHPSPKLSLSCRTWSSSSAVSRSLAMWMTMLPLLTTTLPYTSKKVQTQCQQATRKANLSNRKKSFKTNWNSWPSNWKKLAGRKRMRWMSRATTTGSESH